MDNDTHKEYSVYNFKMFEIFLKTSLMKMYLLVQIHLF